MHKFYKIQIVLKTSYLILRANLYLSIRGNTLLSIEMRLEAPEVEKCEWVMSQAQVLNTNHCFSTFILHIYLCTIYAYICEILFSGFPS